MAAPRATQPRERGARAQAGAFRIGDTAGTLENIVACKLHRPGSVGFVSKSGGMSNEMYNVLARVTDGLYEGPHLPARPTRCGGTSWGGTRGGGRAGAQACCRGAQACWAARHACGSPGRPSSPALRIG